MPAWVRLEGTTRAVFSRYGFREIRTPILEAAELFSRSVGPTSDIVGKEMYTFGSGDDAACLRPESTASVVRAFVEHALHRGVAAGYPERYYYMGPMFRRERPQKGRQRQFHQIGVEVLGAEQPLADAETIQMVAALLDALGVAERELVLNSVGDEHCRPAYRARLRAWLAPRIDRLCEDCRRRYDENPLRVLDCKVPEDRRTVEGAPRLADALCAPCDAHFSAVRQSLERLGVPYRIDPHIVRGLDYYVRTVFEITSPALGAQNAILGGGRYDGLVEALGGPPLPGFGFAIGMERLLSLMSAPPSVGAVDVALVTLGPEGWAAAVGLASRLRAAGIGCVMPLEERPMGAQLRRADRMQARYALFVGGAELASGHYGLKDLRSGEQVVLREEQVAPRVKEARA
jgi:histidyl-tRNA synthetase